MQFKIASQTKTFTADLILQLVGERKISLGDHISKWIAGVPNGGQITIRELLNHTSGLGDGFSLPAIQAHLATGCTVRYLLTTEATAPVVAAPGAKWSYSNYGYNLLGRVVELVTGQNLSTAIRKRITVPLGRHRAAHQLHGAGVREAPVRSARAGLVAADRRVVDRQRSQVVDDAAAVCVTCDGRQSRGRADAVVADRRVRERERSPAVDPAAVRVGNRAWDVPRTRRADWERLRGRDAVAGDDAV
jgi:D-alanyl-D-alanine carboxypeptidase